MLLYAKTARMMRNSLRHIREEPKVHCTLSTIRGHLINSRHIHTGSSSPTRQDPSGMFISQFSLSEHIYKEINVQTHVFAHVCIHDSYYGTSSL